MYLNNVTQCIAQNQIAIGSGPNQGKNFRTVFITQAADPPMAANESSIFTEKPAAEIELYFKRQGELHIQLTGPRPTNATDGFTFLPGKLLLQWGFATLTGDITTIVYPIDFGAAAYSVVLTGYRSNSGTYDICLDTGSVGLHDFNIRRASSSSITKVSWMAIGTQ